MASILSIRMQKCSHIKGSVNVLRPFSNVMNMRDVCLQHHSPLDKVKQSATKADFTIHGRKDEKEDDLFPDKQGVDKNNADSELSDVSDSDTTDSEESIYSGLEEEEEGSDSDESEEDSDVIASEEDEDEEADSKDNIKIQEVRNVTGKKTGKKQPNNIVIKKEKDSVESKNVAERQVDEYDQDSSDEEDIRNTVGNIPMEWYRNFTHIGYDVEGRKLIKPKQGDHLDDFLNKVDDPNYWRTVLNKLTGQNVLLTKEDVKMIQNIHSKKHPTASSGDLYAPWVDFFTNEVMIHPLSNRPEDKRSFIPSKWEKLKVGQYVHALKMGWMKPTPKEEEKKDEDEEDIPNYYMLWKEEDETEISKRFRQHIPAPRMPLPGHAESYNPPPEYLFTKEEEEKWKEKDPADRRINFIPQKYSNLRSVPSYKNFVKERFERCLDLYLCPRQRKMRMNVNPEDLIPKLPKPKDLQPFPTTQALIYLGHTDMVRCVSVDPSGQWIVSGSDDHTVRVWEVSTGRCMKTLQVGGTVRSIAWNPNPSVCLVACTIDNTVILVNPGVGDKLQVTNTDEMLKAFDPTELQSDSKTPVTWSVYEGKEYEDGFRLKLPHSMEVTHVSWHGKGDYFSAVMPKGNTKAVLIHQLSKRRSQNPFSKSKGLIQCVQFHPIRPFLFVATQRYVRVYNLLKQELSKKLTANCKWVSSMAVHPEGDNVIIGSYDSRLSWFDLDLSTKPYQTLRHHKKAVRQVCYHKRYPLFASASDDCTIIVCHGMVYNDLLQNPLIVPVKVLRGHTPEKSVGILDCVFHPSQPWIFSAGADGTIRLYT